ncbi:hypothetical protein F2Q68_00010363 [Brassica cretica]|uniref:NAD-dependent epimerase/dehydratase domain-containing protein n=1 Tax=Brassica cretica TaxID=69181 RepID=A0A8S9L685_BRACR|nr:hypothetical protein F2Q68_00010363 [Brassica cretica]
MARDFTYIDDIVKGYLGALDTAEKSTGTGGKKRGPAQVRVFNLGNTSPVPVSDLDVLNNLTEVRSSDRTRHTDRDVPRASRLELWLEPRPDDRFPRTEARLPRQTRHSKTHGRARLSLGGEEIEDEHAFSSGQSRKRSYLYPVHPSGSDEPGHLD